MDKRTEIQLSRIGNQIPKSLIKRSVVKEGGEQEAIARDILKNPKLDQATRDQLQGLVDKGAFNDIHDLEDPKVIAQMDRFVDRRVKHEIRSGRLKPADKNDPFIRKMRKQMRGKPKEVELKWTPPTDRSEVAPSRRRQM